MIGHACSRFEILERTVSSELPYVTVLGSWNTRDGAFALAENYAVRTYPGFHVTGYPDHNRIMVREHEGEIHSQIWVWENAEVEND